MNDIPPEVALNFDQTGINYVPVSSWNMEKREQRELK